MKEIFRREDENAPNFLGRTTYFTEEHPPVRAYFHGAGFRDTFGGKLVARNRLVATLYQRAGLFSGGDFLLATVWGDNGVPTIDLYEFKANTEWKKNPNYTLFVLKDGIFVPDRRDTCGDMIIMAGAEERYRRTTENLDEYMAKGPGIEGLVAEEFIPEF